MDWQCIPSRWTPWGGDNAPQAVVEGAKLAVEEFPDIAVQLYGPEDVLKPLVGGLERVEVVHAPDVIGMHDSPMLAVRQKTESSHGQGGHGRARGQGRTPWFPPVPQARSWPAACCASAASVASSARRLAPVIPGRKKPFLLIDCGANVDCQPRYLQQFGLMGAVYMQSVQGVAHPEVGLANIGTEAEKGDKLTREAYALMSQQTAYAF